MHTHTNSQRGSSLIEVLVAVLVLSFGMLALGGMLSYAVQLPKLSGYRASATLIAGGYIDRIRANATAFRAGAYVTASTTYNTVLPVVAACTYPLCQPSDIAAQDKDEANRALREALPGNTAGMFVTCEGACDTNREGNLWIIWDEPSTTATLNTSNSDECPPGLVPAQTIAPRCLLVRFKL